MYYQVVIPESERDVLRFLWFGEDQQVVEMRMTRHVFGGVWCASSAIYALHQSAMKDDLPDDVKDTIFRSFYVDDCLCSAPSSEQVVKVALGTKEVLQESGFRLTKFVSNSSELLSAIPSSDLAVDKESIITDSRILGLKWDVMKDQFYLDYQFDASDSLTRRRMLQVISSIFDPLGLISPMVVRGKVLLQTAVRSKCAWDEIVPSALMQEWNKWLDKMKDISQLRFPRCFSQGDLRTLVECELHFFSDASDIALGCCCYFRFVFSTGEVHVSLLMSKSKVTPMKKMSIPRLELEAAVMAVKLNMRLREELDIRISNSHFWTDSEVTLKYIANESRRFHTFVANRVSFIRQFSEVHHWHHVSGQENVADLISRGCCVLGRHQDRWLFGPPFLHTPTSQWEEYAADGALIDDPELKRDQQTFKTVVAQEHPLTQLCAHFSSWTSLVKAVAWWMRFFSVLKGETFSSPFLTLQERYSAEAMLIMHVQRIHFPEELQRLSKNENLHGGSKVKKLDPFIDDCRLLRVGGRLKHCEALGHGVHPILIPHDHIIADLLATHYHVRAHLGTEWVVSQLRQRFWITHARVVVKRVARKCVSCKKLFADPCVQKMANLPPARVEPYKPPFSSTGVDCFGPFQVKRARSEVKRYGCIFCCFATRAVHLEILCDLSTDSFFNAFRRFAARRGTPQHVWSDNGTNFVGGQRAMFNLDETVIARNSLAANVDWHFNIPLASHMGGVWERIIRTIHKVLAGVLPRNARLTDECLNTVLCEVELIINSRPLTKVSEDPLDPAPLTPNHLLLLNSCPALSPGIFQESDVYRKRWRCVQHIANSFWARWLKEYLPILQARQKWLTVKRSLKVGDLVLLEENAPRGVWPLGLVIGINLSADGLVRSVRLRLKNRSEVSRPATKCIFLEETL